jgi:hypothetical protein
MSRLQATLWDCKQMSHVLLVEGDVPVTLGHNPLPEEYRRVACPECNAVHNAPAVKSPIAMEYMFRAPVWRDDQLMKYGASLALVRCLECDAPLYHYFRIQSFGEAEGGPWIIRKEEFS